MALHNKTLQFIASKLGLHQDQNILNKAAEYERLLETKSTAGTSLTDTSKVFICLDLAAEFFGTGLEKSAIKYSGLKPSAYSSSRKTVENLLEINVEKINVATLCLMLQCTEVQELAERIIISYQKNAKMELDLNLPQYVCMAVYQACRINKVKVSKSKLIEKSRLKPAQWSKLDADWTKHVDQHFAVTKKKKKSKKEENNDVDENVIEDMELDIPKENDEPNEAQIEPYEEWKRRVLEQAYKEIAELKAKKPNLEIDEDDRIERTPRRSPRKTPTKFSPYKTPNKAVKLVFNLNR